MRPHQRMFDLGSDLPYLESCSMHAPLTFEQPFCYLLTCRVDQDFAGLPSSTRYTFEEHLLLMKGCSVRHLAEERDDSSVALQTRKLQAEVMLSTAIGTDFCRRYVSSVLGRSACDRRM